ncbi:MAG TPA: DUF6804 family protein [Candidatus Paceibacterota bacterium]|nr:DUF6804 family protein [Candidatus Paceibacterota bacterium]
MRNKGYSGTLSTVSGIMLLAAIPFGWPYFYFQLLRWVVCTTAIVNAYEANKKQRRRWVFIMAGIAVLFNPIAPIFLSRGVWAIIDLAAAVCMFVILDNE